MTSLRPFAAVSYIRLLCESSILSISIKRDPSTDEDSHQYSVQESPRTLLVIPHTTIPALRYFVESLLYEGSRSTKKN